MKTRINQLKTLLKNLWTEEAAQGATEYILLLVVVVGLAMAFKPKIKSLLDEKMGAISTDVGGFTSQN